MTDGHIVIVDCFTLSICLRQSLHRHGPRYREKVGTVHALGTLERWEEADHVGVSVETWRDVMGTARTDDPSAPLWDRIGDTWEI